MTKKTVKKQNAHEEISNIPIRKNGAPPPYHVFEVFNDFFCFDTSTKALYKIDEVSYILLAKCLEGVSIQKASTWVLTEGRFDATDVDSAAREIMLLAHNGLFDVPNYKFTDEELEISFAKYYENFSISSIILAMSESCNLACRYCYCGDRLHTRNISRANIRESIHWMLENSGDNQELELVFFGGEPLMNRSGIEYAIDYSTEIGKCYSKSFKYRMTSNVTLIDDKIADFLVKNKVQVLVSLDGPQEIHDMQCPTVAGGGSFEMASAGAKRLLQRQKNVAVRSTVTSPVTNIEMLLKFYEEFGFSSLNIA